VSKTNTTLVWTCHKKDDDTLVWSRLPGRMPLEQIDDVMCDGDFHYDNPGLSPKDELVPRTWARAWERQADTVPDIGAIIAAKPFITRMDDHDIGVENNTFHGDNIDIANVAYKASWPAYPYPPGMPSTGTNYFSVDRAGVCHIYYDCRSNYRSDPDAADVTWNPGDPAPTKTVLGSQQDTWFSTIIQRTDVVGFVHYFSMGLTGQAADFVPFGTKKDAIAWYPEWRKWWASLASTRPGLIVTGDWHVTGACDADPYAGLPLIHPTGANRESGNTTWPTEWDYQWPPTVLDPDDPDDPGMDQVLNILGFVQTEWSGTRLTLTGIVYDAILDADRFTVSQSWTVAPEPASELPIPSYNLGALKGHDDYGRWYLDPATTDPNLPEKRAGVGDASRGVRVNSVRTGAGSRGLTWVVTDRRIDGSHGGKAQVWANERTMMGQLNTTLPVSLEYLPDKDLPATEQATVFITGPVVTTADTSAAALSRLSVLVTIPDGPMRGLAAATWAQDLSHDYTGPVPILAGSTFATTDAWVQLRGPASALRLTDVATGSGFFYKSPIDDDFLLDGDYALINTVTGDVWLGTTDSWDPADYTSGPLTNYVSSYGPGLHYLPLTPTPQDGDIDNMQVIVEAKSPNEHAGPQTRLSIRAVPSYV
jgi:hypothetical protein